MSLLTRPSVVFAIVFACFAVLIPRVFLPLFRSKPSAPTQNLDDHFRRPPPPTSQKENGDTIQHIPGSPPHIRGGHPNMRMHHPGANGHQQAAAADNTSSKSIVTLALPMYTVGIGIFFIYTCCKYWSKKNTDETKTKKPRLTDDLLWNVEKRKLKCDMLDKDSEEDDENKEEFYAGLDPDYIEYLKSKKQKALDAEQVMTEEQKQMHYALEEMKKSLSFISSKLVAKENRGNLNGNEINQLQDRLASTEAQMCKILSALDSASNKVAVTTKPTKKTAKIEQQYQKSKTESSSSPSSSDDEGVPNQVDDEEEEGEEHCSVSLSSSNSSAEEEQDDDQSAPIAKQNVSTNK